MGIQARIGIVSSHSLCSKTVKHSNSSSKVLCSSRKDSRENDNANNGDKPDWDNAWKSYRSQGKNKKKKKKSFLSDLSPDKYVSWNPRRSEFPLSEEIDPIKRAERSNLRFWNSPEFTLGGAIVLVTFLLIYSLLAPVK